MHYVSGHEVAKQLTTEVYQLAFSATKAWIRRESKEETYMCQVGGMIALKLQACFDCSPEMMMDIILERQAEWDLNSRGIEVLEEYDSSNKIMLLQCQLPMFGKVVYLCLYRCVVSNHNTKQYHIVYQSIDHDRIPSDEPVITVAPSGYFVSAAEDEPNKCLLTSVFQFPAESVDNPTIIASLCSSSERIIAGLRGVVMRSNEEVDNWDTAINKQRKELYNRMHDMDPANGWLLRYQYAGVRCFTKQFVHGEFCVCTRTSFTMPHPSHDVVTHLFAAFQKSVEWDSFIAHTEPAEFVRDYAYLQRFAYTDLCEGHIRHGCVLSAMHTIKDNICDLSYKISLQDKPTAIGYLHGSMPSCGFIVYPSSDNPGVSTIQYMMQTSHPTACTDVVLRSESARLIAHLNCLVGYITKQLRIKLGQHITSAPNTPPGPQSPTDVACAQVFEDYSEVLVLEDRLPFEFSQDPVAPRETARSTFDQTNRSRTKRKITRNLMNVEDVVFKNPRKPETGTVPLAKPFLFLVSDDGGASRRFVRRRRGSPLVHSNFDLLPQEILLEVFMFLDPIALANISHTCTHIKELVMNCQLWRSLYENIWGEVRGRIARRYCGDDDPATFFTSVFPDWKELFLERQYIEAAWEIPERRALSFSVTKAHARTVRSMALLPSRHRLVTGSRDRLVRVWDVTSGACLLALQGPSSCVSVEAWSETHVKVGYKDGVVRLFDVMTEECTGEMRMSETMRGCIFTGNSVISWQDNAVHWDETTNQSIATFAGHTQRIKECALCPTKSVLYTASRDTTVRLWDFHNNIKITSIEGHTKSINSIALVGENHCITGSSDKNVKVWDVRKLSTPVHVFPEHKGKIRSIRYSAIGQKICVGGEHGVSLWRNKDYSFIRKDFAEDTVSTLAMDEESVAYGGINGQVKFYDFTPHR